MNRPILVCALLVATATALGAQDSSQPAAQNGPYQGVSKPPSDDEIITTEIPAPKPRAGKPLDAPSVSVQEAAPVQSTDPVQPRPTSVDPAVNFPSANAADGTDDGIVHVAPNNAPLSPSLSSRTYAYDPDGDIVHPHPLRPGELQEGTSIRVRLLGRLSTAETEKGQEFRTRVATDVMQGGAVVIPAGSEISGRVVQVSSGHFGGHGTMRLEPDSVILPNGSRFRLHGEVTGTPGSRTRIGGEGTIRPGSRAKRDSIEYGGAVGSGVVVGAIIAGPVGALTGGLIGAGAVTVHLLVDHPQATLETGTTLVFTLTDRLYLAPDTTSGN